MLRSHKRSQQDPQEANHFYSGFSLNKARHWEIYWTFNNGVVNKKSRKFDFPQIVQEQENIKRIKQVVWIYNALHNVSARQLIGVKILQWFAHESLFSLLAMNVIRCALVESNQVPYCLDLVPSCPIFSDQSNNFLDEKSPASQKKHNQELLMLKLGLYQDFLALLAPSRSEKQGRNRYDIYVIQNRPPPLFSQRLIMNSVLHKTWFIFIKWPNGGLDL